MSMDKWTTKQLASLFATAEQTIRNWADEFTQYLSPSANPGEKRDRRFTRDDLTVFAYIAQNKKAGFQFQDIHRGLASGQRGAIPALDPETVDIILATEETHRAELQLKHAEATIQRLSEEVEELRQIAAKLPQVERERDTLAVEIKFLKEQMDTLKAQIEQEYKRGREIGKLEGRLEELDKRPKE